MPQTAESDALVAALTRRPQVAAAAPPPQEGGVLPTAARIGGAVVGGLAGLPLGPAGVAAGGALGAAGGELFAQQLEERPIAPGEVAIAGALGAIPFFGRAGSTILRNAFKRGVQGAVFGGAETTARSLVREGELPQTSDFLLSLGVGAVLGGAGGGVEARTRQLVSRRMPEGTPQASPVSPTGEQLKLPLTRPPRSPETASGVHLAQGNTLVEEMPALPKPDGVPPGRGPRSIEDLPSDMFQVELNPQVVGQFVRLLEESPDALQEIGSNFGKRLRLYEILGNAMEEAGIPKEQVDFYRKMIRSDGQRLNWLGQLQRSINKIMKDAPAAQAALQQLEQATTPDNVWQRFLRIYHPIENVRRGLLTTQVATTMRNIVTQAPRYGVEMLDQSIQGVLGGHGFGNAPELALNVVQQFGPGKMKSFIKAYEGVTEAVTRSESLKRTQLWNRLIATPAGEMTLGNRFTRLLNTFNIWQEQFFRRAAFDATIRGELRRRGMDIAEAFATPSSIPTDILDLAVNRAMDVTFANVPMKGTLGAGILNAYEKLPILTTVHPFPRFMVNGYKFIADFNPAGILRLLSRDAEGKFFATNEAVRNEIISRASIGTGLLATAFAVRNSDLAGDKWYQVSLGGKTFDLRPHAPFSSFLFLHDIFSAIAEHGTDVILNGKDLKEVLQARHNLDGSDFAQAILGMSRLSSTGLLLTDAIKPGMGADQIWNVLRDAGAGYISGFTVPFRTVRDVVAGFSPEAAIERDTRKTMFGPLRANIPFEQERLPERRTITRGVPLETETPLLRQFTGMGGKTLRPLEEEMGRLNLSVFEVSPRTGDADTDRIITKRAGQIVEAVAPKVLRSPVYKAASDQEKILLLKQMFGEARGFGRAALAAERPDLAVKLLIRRQGRDVVRLLRKRGIRGDFLP